MIVHVTLVLLGIILAAGLLISVLFAIVACIFICGIRLLEDYD